MLPDSAHIQEIEVEQLNKRNARRHLDPVAPIYETADAMACLERFRPVSYATWFDVSPDIRARFWNAGHLLGSASVEVEVQDADGNRPLRLLFSADIGPNFKLLHPDPDSPNATTSSARGPTAELTVTTPPPRGAAQCFATRCARHSTATAHF